MISQQKLCGTVDLYEKGPGGTEVWKPHELQTAQGVCLHEDAELWEQFLDGQEGDYIGTTESEGWRVHLWVKRSALRIPAGRPREFEPESEETRERRRQALDALTGWKPELPPPAPMSPDAFKRVEEEVAGPHPAPEEVGDWLSLPAAGEEGRFPKSTLDLAWHGAGRRWDVRLRYARGTFQAATGKAGAKQESVCVAFRGPGRREAVVVYAKRGKGGWKAETVWMWGPDLLPFGLAGVTDLKEWLEQGGDVPAEFWAEIRKRRADQKVRQGQAALARRAEKGTGGGAKKEAGG